MKKLLIGLLAATMITSPACANPAPAQAPAANAAAPSRAALPDADPAMWVVRDEDTTVYLFGTFHLMDGKSDWFNDEVKEAFDRSQELVFEIDLPEDQAQMAALFQPLVARYAPDTSGRSLKNRLTPEEYKTLYDALGPLGVPPGAFDPLEPWFASFMLIGALSQKLGLTPEAGAESVLKKAGRERNMTLSTVETLEDQIKMFDSAPDAKQLEELKEALKDLDKAGEVFPRMLAAWNSGDPEGIDQLINEGMKDDPEARRRMLGARNEKWANWIDQRMDKPGVVFMAVGAGHLVGSDSVQTFLAKRNIQSQRVPNATPGR